MRLRRTEGDVRNPDLSDTTQGEGQYYEAVFNRGTQGAEHKEKCGSGGRKCSWV